MKRRSERALWLTLIALLLPFMLGGCHVFKSWEGEGKVVEQRYDDPDEWYVDDHYENDCGYKYGADGEYTYRCTVEFVPGRWHYDGPHWVIIVEDHEKKVHTIGVTEALYDTCYKGRTYNNTETEECTSR